MEASAGLFECEAESEIKAEVERLVLVEGFQLRSVIEVIAHSRLGIYAEKTGNIVLDAGCCRHGELVWSGQFPFNVLIVFRAVGELARLASCGDTFFDGAASGCVEIEAAKRGDAVADVDRNADVMQFLTAFQRRCPDSHLVSYPAMPFELEWRGCCGDPEFCAKSVPAPEDAASDIERRPCVDFRFLCAVFL